MIFFFEKSVILLNQKKKKKKKTQGENGKKLGCTALFRQLKKTITLG